MAKWYAFPPRSPLRLHYTLEDGGQRRFILRMPPRINAPNLFAAGWRRPGGIAGLLSGMAPDPAALFPRGVRQWMAQHGAESIDLPQAELRRRYFVPRVCPLNALTIGINRNGAEVRESGDDRWLVLDGLSQEESWAGSERLLLGGQLDLSLRMRDPSQYQPLAARIADEVAVNRLRINPDEMQELAAALIKPGHRDLPTWTASADQSYALLQQEIMLAMLAPARDSAARPLHSSARRLISAIPSLRDGGDTDPPPDVMAALAAVVGPLEAAQLVAPNGDATRGWGRFFTGADDSHAVLDLRGLPPHEAAATITTECARRNGRVVTLLATDPHSDDGAPVLQAWQDVARVRGVEAAAVLPDETVWEGPATFIAFGQRRENPLDAATGVSMRLEREQVREDLSHWIYEAQRGRAGIAGQQDRLAKLTDYRPASNVSTAVLKLPRAQAADARRAMRRLMTDHGAVDAYVAGIMGLEPAELAVDPATGHGWSAEQIDAIALAESAHRDQGRGFILADQTGTGKGRTAMGCARAWLNGGAHRKVIYLTVDKAVAVDGVLRDLVDTATEGLAGRPLVIARDSEPPADLADAARSINQRRELYQSRGFPADRRFLISTYPAFQAAKWDDPDPDKTDNDRAPAAWLQAVCNDPAVMVILDESHKALNREGNIGHNMRAAIAHAGRVLFVSATALRDGRNVDLYRRVFPPTMSPEDFQIIEAMLRRASAMELESFAASLIRDGVMLRREHDSADIIRSVAGPTDTETQSYDQVMNGLRGLASALLEAKRTIRTRNMGGAGQGWRHWSDAAQVNMTAGMGVILDQISSLTLASMTIPQTARVASLNIAKGRKPVISMTRTNESYLQRILSGDALLTPGEEHRIGDQYQDGVATYQPFPPRQLDARDYFKEQAARLFDITISDRGHRPIPEGGRGVAVRRRGGPIRRNLLDEARRGEAPDIARVWNRIVEAVETLPALPVSPFDALKQELAKNPDGSGRVPTLVEITDRELFINDDGEIEKINKTNDHKQRAAARFNNGDADILVFSPESGGTGASYHASETFADQRPREYIQNGFANNILTFVQSGGRTCRFGQVATPGHTVIDTGTVPDRRAQKIHNAKLRNLGAINEGDRQHDAIRDDVPDILNRIGADATSRVLEALPDIRARLGDPEYNPGRGDTAEAFLRKILNAQLLLDPDDNHKFNNLCDYEYNQLLEEMNSVGNNPLETQKLRGDVFIRARSRFIEDNDSLSTDPHDIHSALQEPVELLTGDWYREPGLRGQDVHDMAAEARAQLEASGPAAQATPQAQGARIAAALTAGRHDENRDDMRTFSERLTTAVIGSIWKDRRQISFTDSLGVVVGYSAPPAELADHAISHRFLLARPGNAQLETISAKDFMRHFMEDDSGLFGRAGPPPPRVVEAFNALASPTGNTRPIQILRGSPFTTARAAERMRNTRRYIAHHHLRPYLLTERNERGESYRAWVNTDPGKLDLANTPFRITAASMIDAARADSLGATSLHQKPRATQETRASLRKSDHRPEYLLQIRATNKGLAISGKAISKSSIAEFWGHSTGPQLYRALTGTKLPAVNDTIDQNAPIPARTFRLANRDEGQRAAYVAALLDAHPGVQLMAAGQMRAWYGEHGHRNHEQRKATWQPQADFNMPSVAELAQTGNQDRPLLRASWANGAVMLSALPPQGHDTNQTGHDGIGINSIGGWVLELPDFRTPAAAYWRSEAGRKLWQMIEGCALPDIARVALDGDVAKRAVLFTDPEEAHTAATLAWIAAASLGARSELNRDSEVPIRANNHDTVTLAA